MYSPEVYNLIVDHKYKEALNQIGYLPENDEGLILQSDILHKIGNNEDAKKLLNRVNITKLDDIIKLLYYTVEIQIAMTHLNYNAVEYNLQMGGELLETLDVESEKENLIVGNYYNSIANYYRQLGSINDAIINYRMAELYRKQLKHKTHYGLLLNNMGSLNLNIGEYDEAKTYFVRALAIGSEIPESPVGFYVRYNMGMLHYYEKDFEKAINSCKVALKYAFSHLIPKFDIAVLYSIQLICNLNIDPNRAVDNLNEIKKLNVDKDPLINNLIELNQAFIDKSSTRYSIRAKSQMIFQKYASIEFYFFYKNIIYLNYASLLMEEYKTFREPEALTELENLLIKMQKESEMNKSEKHQIDVLVLQLKFHTMLHNEIERNDIINKLKQRITSKNRLEELINEHSNAKSVVSYLKSLGTIIENS